jgi:hypothetical protein
MSSTNKAQLLTILKGLREYISNEYTLNADGSKGGDSTMSVDKDLDADWVNKLDPLSGGQGGEREGALGKTTSAAKQGANPYLHKNVDEDEELLANLESNEEEEDLEDNLEENVEDNEDEETDEIIDEELGGMYGKSADGAILNLLKDVKGLLESRHMEKAAMSDIREELDDIRKAMPTSVEAGIKSGMKGFGFTPTAGEMKRVKPKSKRNNRVSGHQIQKSVTSAPSAPIGVEGDSLANLGAGDAMSEGEAQQGQFVDAVETILKSNDTDDLRGTFKKVNSMRDQQGDVAPSTLYYHKMGGS